MGRVRDIIENERGLISDTVATDKEVQATSGYRNHIIDGSFSLCQKSDTPIDGTGYSCVDMWYQSDCSIEQSFDAGGLPYAKCTCDDSEAENIISHHLENAKQYLNKSITVSFDMDSPDYLYTNSVILSYSDVDGNTVSLEKTINCTDIRTRYSVTFEFEGTSIPADREALKLDIYGDKSSDNQNGKVFNVYNVQLEFGDVATPFEIEPAGITLNRAHRYFWYTGYASPHMHNYADHRMNIFYPVLMRVYPSITITEGEDDISVNRRGRYFVTFNTGSECDFDFIADARF